MSTLECHSPKQHRGAVLATELLGLAEILAADEPTISLEAASCPRFHVDRIGIRMLVTYRGPGTGWLPDAQVDRRWLDAAGMGCPDEQNGVMPQVAEVLQVPTWAVALLKGEAWPKAEGFGVVHRSPNPKGVPRVLLRVDMLSQEPIEAQEAKVT